MNADQSRKVAERIVAILFYALLTLLLGTAAGIWIKLFWLGWVFASAH